MAISLEIIVWMLTQLLFCNGYLILNNPQRLDIFNYNIEIDNGRLIWVRNINDGPIDDESDEFDWRQREIEDF